MQKLIIDEAANQLVIEKLSGALIFSDENGDFLSPGVIEVLPSDDDLGEKWQPGDELTKQLVLAADAAQELTFLGSHFWMPGQRARTIKSMTVPVCSLMDIIVKIRKQLNSDELRKKRDSWPTVDKKTYTKVGRSLTKKRLQGPVRIVRNKIGAHLDVAAFSKEVPRLKLEDLLKAMGDSLILLALSITNCTQRCSWVRHVAKSKDGKRMFVDSMFEYPICLRWETDLEGKVLDVGNVRLAEDPRRAIYDRAMKAIDLYNTLSGECSVGVQGIWTRPMDEVLAEEKRMKQRESP